jgi:hypothetical protein
MMVICIKLLVLSIFSGQVIGDPSGSKDECPNSHPFPYFEGDKCCKKPFDPYERKCTRKNFDSYYSPCCSFNDTIECPHGQGMCQRIHCREDGAPVTLHVNRRIQRHRYNTVQVISNLIGLISDECPESHPFPFLEGDRCCETEEEKHFQPDGERCDRHDFNINSSCCRFNNHIECPHGPRRCHRIHCRAIRFAQTRPPNWDAGSFEKSTESITSTTTSAVSTIPAEEAAASVLYHYFYGVATTAISASTAHPTTNTEQGEDEVATEDPSLHNYLNIDSAGK